MSGHPPSPSPRWRTASFLVPIFAALFFCIVDMPAPAFGDGGVTIRPDALLKTGAQGGGEWILPNGRRITPAGVEVVVDNLPLGLAVSPDGAHLLVTTAGRGRRSVTVVDVVQASVVDAVQHEDLFLGIAMSRDGSRVYASGGGGEVVHVHAFEDGDLTLTQSWQVLGFPAGMALSPDGSVLFVVSQLRRRLRAIDTATGTILSSAPLGPDPYTVALHPDGNLAYVSSERHDKVDVIDTTDPAKLKLTRIIPTQKNPEGLAVTADGEILFVTNADEDSVTVVATCTGQVTDTIDLRPYVDGAYGSSPNALAFSSDGTRLYVAQATDNKISVLSVPEGELLGAIPTSWYPTAVAVSPDGSTLFVANAKGRGSGPSKDDAKLDNGSTIQIIPVPTDVELAALTARVEANNAIPCTLFDVNEENFDNPIPLEPGGPTPIKHVIIAIRENKTYDALLGDWPHGDGEPRNCVYCDETTPSFRALVERFASGDNYYSNAEASIQGHVLVTASTVNTYMEKLWKTRKRLRPMEYDAFLNPTAWPKMDFIFQNALRHGVSFRDYGEAIGVGKDLLILDPEYVHWSWIDPAFYYPLSHDEAKVVSRIGEFESGIFPSLIFMLLPNDHTNGCVFPFPTPRSMIADNDRATGRLIDWVSHSEHWPETVVFVVEDDPQQGRDHVDAHRSVLLVASPWVKRRYVSPVHYSEAHMHATVQRILGMEPMTIFDECAQPMWDLFTSEPDFEPFDAPPREQLEEISIPGTTCSKASRGLDFVDPDEAEGLQELLWAHESKLRDLREADTTAIHTAGTGSRLRKGEAAMTEAVAKPDLTSPTRAFLSVGRVARGGELDEARSLYTRESKRLLKRYDKLMAFLKPTVLPADASEAFLSILRDRSPRVVSETVNGDRATLDVVYSNGLEAEVRFEREGRKWRLDLAGEIEDAVRIMEAFKERFETFARARAKGVPVESTERD